jgi:cation diffusion facilitator CzcD-associated flavoprotein CzcO
LTQFSRRRVFVRAAFTVIAGGGMAGIAVAHPMRVAGFSNFTIGEEL